MLMPAYALLESNVQELLENDRNEYLAKRVALLKQTKQEIALAYLVGVARKAISTYPDVRYVQLAIKSNVLTDGIVHVTEVLDADRNVIAEEPYRGLCMRIEQMFFTGERDTFSTLTAGEYDFVELAGRQL